MTKKLIKRAFGSTDPRDEGYRRTLKGLREGNQRDLYLGLALAAISYLQRTKPKKQLLYRETVPTGSAVVVHHHERGGARLEIIKPED